MILRLFVNSSLEQGLNILFVNRFLPFINWLHVYDENYQTTL